MRALGATRAGTRAGGTCASSSYAPSSSVRPDARAFVRGVVRRVHRALLVQGVEARAAERGDDVVVAIEVLAVLGEYAVRRRDSVPAVEAAEDRERATRARAADSKAVRAFDAVRAGFFIGGFHRRVRRPSVASMASSATCSSARRSPPRTARRTARPRRRTPGARACAQGATSWLIASNAAFSTACIAPSSGVSSPEHPWAAARSARTADPPAATRTLPEPKHHRAVRHPRRRPRRTATRARRRPAIGPPTRERPWRAPCSSASVPRTGSARSCVRARASGTSSVTAIRGYFFIGYVFVRSYGQIVRKRVIIGMGQFFFFQCVRFSFTLETRASSWAHHPRRHGVFCADSAPAFTPRTPLLRRGGARVLERLRVLFRHHHLINERREFGMALRVSLAEFLARSAPPRAGTNAPDPRRGPSPASPRLIELRRQRGFERGARLGQNAARSLQTEARLHERADQRVRDDLNVVVVPRAQRGGGRDAVANPGAPRLKSHRLLRVGGLLRAARRVQERRQALERGFPGLQTVIHCMFKRPEVHHAHQRFIHGRLREQRRRYCSDPARRASRRHRRRFGVRDGGKAPRRPRRAAASAAPRVSKFTTREAHRK